MKVMRDENAHHRTPKQIGESVIMFADATEQFAASSGRAVRLHRRRGPDVINKAIAKGATSIMPMADQEYGRSGGFADPFGNSWWPTARFRSRIRGVTKLRRPQCPFTIGLKSMPARSTISTTAGSST